jgi:hypothetical protein
MDPWFLFALLQQAKVHLDLHELDAAQSCMDTVVEALDRFPVLTSHCHEVVGQARMMRGDEKALESFHAAVDAAEESGLLARRDLLLQVVSRLE